MRIVIDERQLDGFTERARRYERALRLALHRLDQQSELLTIALHDLALARSAKDPEYFAQRWRHEHRQRERSALPESETEVSD